MGTTNDYLNDNGIKIANSMIQYAGKTNYMVLGTHNNRRKYIDIKQDINVLNESESTNSTNLEKGKT